MKRVYFFFICLILSISVLSINTVRAETNNAETLRLLDLFGDVFEKIRKEYVEEPTDKDLIESAINGMLTDLDPHSSYLNKESFNEMRVQTKGKFGGLGIEVTMRNGMVYIVSPIDDTPAFKAGLKAGDYISHIDSEAVVGMVISDAVKKMRGKPGTKITLTIIRDLAEEPFDVTLTRAVINIKSARSDTYEDIGYIRITSFSEQTGKSLRSELKKIQKKIGKNLKGIVLDLRNNPGGLLNQAIQVTDTFLDRGEIVSTRGRLPDSAKRFNATRGDEIEGLPMVVLINGGSASASEIVAGALQDHKRAIIVGTKSFGKGSVQTVIPLPKDSAIRLTTSRYYTPAGTSIQAEGIMPDIIVEPAKVEFLKKTKRTSEANLRGHLKNKGKKDSSKKDGDGDDTTESLYTTDYQLARAIDLLRSVHIFNSANSKTLHAFKNNSNK